jgi:hypothetical protein
MKESPYGIRTPTESSLPYKRLPLKESHLFTMRSKRESDRAAIARPFAAGSCIHDFPDEHVI